MKPCWRDTPVALTGLHNAHSWWKVEYDRHIEAGFSDADARLMVADLARFSKNMRRIIFAQQQERI